VVREEDAEAAVETVVVEVAVVAAEAEAAADVAGVVKRRAQTQFTVRYGIVE
jgi:hypothetical protein